MNRLLKSSGVFALMTMVSRVLGLVRDIVIAKYFEVGQTDIFFTALRIPNTLRRFFAEGAFANAFVPVLNHSKAQDSDDELQSLINHVFGVLGFALLIITLLGVTFSGALIAVIGFGFADDPNRLALGETMLRITFPYILLISLTAFFAGILNAYHKFALPAFTPALLNIALIIAALYFRERFNPPVLALAWAVFVGGILQLLIQIPTLWRLKRLPVPKVSFRHPGVKKVFTLMLPTLLGSSAGQINILLNTALASSLVSGSITWLYYSDRLVELPVGIIGVAIGTVILPRLATLKSSTDSLQFASTLQWAIRLAIVIGAGAATGLVMLALPMMITILARGEFSLYSAQMAANSLQVFGFGAFALIVVKVLAPGFYAQQNTKTPTKIALFCIAVNIVLALLLYRRMGHVGLALASTVASFVNAGLLFLFLQRASAMLADKNLAIFVMKVLMANAIMAIALYGANAWLTADGSWGDFSQWQRAGYLAALIFFGMISYLVALFCVRIEFKQLIQLKG